jgi:hypothetical protein
MLSRKLMTAVSRGAQFVAYTSSSTDFAGSLLFTSAPTGTKSNDLLVAVMYSPAAATWTGASGWTERVDQGVAPSLRVATLQVGATVPSLISFSYTGGSSDVGGIMLCIRGGVWDSISAISTRTGDGSLAVGGVTSAGGVIIAAAAAASGSPGGAAFTTPSGMTNTATIFGGSSADGAIAAWYQSVVPGATGTRTTTISNSNAGANAGVLISIGG